jgi:hypothetical protein
MVFRHEAAIATHCTCTSLKIWSTKIKAVSRCPGEDTSRRKLIRLAGLKAAKTNNKRLVSSYSKESRLLSEK